MYKLVLCWRYLRTRYIAFASIISVMLGVATMIIVNSVMAGFSSEMQGRIRGIICDVVFESGTLEGMRDPDWHMEQIKRIAGDDIEGMTPICVVPAMLSYQWRGTWVTNQVQVIGIDEKSQSKVSDFAKYLQHPANRQEMSFNLRDGGYDIHDHLAEGPTREREDMRQAGWANRRRMAREQAEQERMLKNAAPAPSAERRDGSPARTVRPAADADRPLRSVSRCRSRSRRSTRRRSRTRASCWASPCPTIARPTARSISASCRARTCNSPSPPPARRPRP